LTLALILGVAGSLVFFAAWIALMVRAFRISVAWGLGSLFVPVGVAFAFTHWEKGGRPLVIAVLGLGVVFAGGLLQGAAELPGSRAPKETPSAAASAHMEKCDVSDFRFERPACVAWCDGFPPAEREAFTDFVDDASSYRDIQQRVPTERTRPGGHR
jgi:hypothetical protein